MRVKHSLRPAYALAAFLILAAGSAFAADVVTPEQQLLSAVAKMKSGDTDGARADLQDLTQRQPNFRLAKQIYGELLAALPGGTLIDNKEDPQLSDLSEEARLRIDGEKAAPPPGYVPDAILQLDQEHPYFIIVDLPKARLYLMHNKGGEIQLVRDHYASMGRKGYGKQSTGDMRTPVGVYHITGWVPKAQLPGIYGEGAFPLNYPNLWDQFNKRGGHGIWLHGVPSDTYVRAPRSSEGCVTMANEDLLAIKPCINNGQTPVILTDALTWVPPDQIKDERDEFLARIEDWRSKWAKRDTAAYLAYYGKDFSVDNMNLAQFTAHKKRVNSVKKFIAVKLHHMNLFRYPGAGEPMMLAEFTLEYHSDNFSATSQKQQFWRKDKEGNWKIFREENR